MICHVPWGSCGLQDELSRLPEEIIPAELRIVLPPGNPGGALGLVLERSRQVCLLLYQKPLFTETMYLEYCTQCQLSLNPEQLAVFAGGASVLSVPHGLPSSCEDSGVLLRQMHLLAQTRPDGRDIPCQLTLQCLAGGRTREVLGCAMVRPCLFQTHDQPSMRLGC